MMNNASKFLNDARLEIEGTFNLNASAAVLTQTNPDGSSFTVTGQGMSVVKNGTGTYDVTVKTSNAAQGPTINPVQILDANANFIGVTLATVLDARIASVALSAVGDLVIKVITAQTSGAAADTTGAITVTFHVVLAVQRMASPL